MASWAPDVTPDAKPVKRHRADTAEWKEIRARFADACCVSCGLPAESLHHIAPRSQGGGDVEENLAPLCGDGTRGCHGKLESHAPGWEQIAAHVRAYVMARESRLSYVLSVLGADRFSARYPEPPFLALGDLDRYSRPDPWLREGTDEL